MNKLAVGSLIWIIGFIIFCVILIWGGITLSKENNLEEPPNKTLVKKINHFIQPMHYELKYSTTVDLKIKDNFDCRKVTGFSMQPTMFTDNTICCVGYKDQELTDGMIIIADNGDHRALHRIIGVYEKGVYTQGDNIDTYESWHYEEILMICPVLLFT